MYLCVLIPPPACACPFASDPLLNDGPLAWPLAWPLGIWPLLWVLLYKMGRSSARASKAAGMMVEGDGAEGEDATCRSNGRCRITK
eukprot:656497-Pelagomonas_calceolata.AAC.3